jgi:hypothetical protein
VRSTTVAPPCSRSDHDAVCLSVGREEQRVARRRAGRKALQYPPPSYAVKGVAAESEILISNLTELLNLEPAVSAKRWDGLKDSFRVAAIRAIRVCAGKLRGSCRQRQRRLRKALALERARVALIRQGGTLEDQFKLLTLDPAARQASLRDAIVAVQETYAARRRIRTLEQYTGHTPDATRAFFRRISIKYSGRRSSRSLSLPSAGDVSGANLLAADWRPILQQPQPTQEARDRFFARLGPQPAAEVEMETEAFSAAEVARAISGCPRGKACGPDGIANDWYRDSIEALAPVPADLFTGWMRARILPESFAKATVFCIPKTAAPRSGLDFRPIARLQGVRPSSAQQGQGQAYHHAIADAVWLRARATGP